MRLNTLIYIILILFNIQVKAQNTKDSTFINKAKTHEVFNKFRENSLINKNLPRENQVISTEPDEPRNISMDSLIASKKKNDGNVNERTNTTNSVLSTGTDDCASAVALITPTNAGTNAGASTTGTDPANFCSYNGTAEGTVWYTYTPPSNGVVTFIITSTANDYPLIGLYEGACGSLLQVSSTCGTGSKKTYTASYTVASCQSYYVMAYDDYVSGNKGTFTISTSFVAGSAGPSNDCCSGAYAIPTANLNGTWNTGFTTANATPDVFGTSGCNYGGNNVWFTFQAQGPNVEITVNGTSTSFEPEISLFNSSPCAANASNLLACTNDYGYFYSGISLLNILSTGVVPLTVGNYYTIMVTNEGTAGTFSIQINNPAPNPPGTDCATAALVCSNSALSGGSNLWGNQELTTSTIGACLNQYGEINSTWYVINVLTGGTLTFTISPTNGTDDFDYSIWQGSTCTLGAPVRCNYSSTVANTGLNLTNTNTTSNATGSPFDKYITTASGDVYIVLVNGYNPNSNIYNMSFGGTAVLGCTLPVVLPIELLNFSATLNGQEVDLKWSTSTETNNSYFTIERSTDGRNFEEITQVKGAGTSKTKLNYTSIDYTPLPGISYYRISQTDLNGKTNLLTITSVNNTDNDGMFKVIPNPTDGIININYSCGTATNGVLNIYDGNGLLILSKEIDCVTGSNKTQLDLGDRASGLYLITFSTNDKFYRTKLMKK